jgi:hypothetical protein
MYCTKGSLLYITNAICFCSRRYFYDKRIMYIYPNIMSTPIEHPGNKEHKETAQFKHGSQEHYRLYVMLFFWVMTPCGPVRMYQCFGEIYSALKMETLSVSVTLVSTYECILRHNPEQQHGHLHRCGNLKFRNNINIPIQVLFHILAVTPY